MDCLKVLEIKKSKNRIDYQYECEGSWNNLLNLDERLFLEMEEDIENVPDSIAVIPLLVNILPIAWVYNLKIKVDAIDRNFFENLDKIKLGYINMYPQFSFLGKLEYDKIEDNKYDATNCGTLFSGGVDAYNTLLNHIDEKPELLTVWGADIKLDDVKGWERVKNNNQQASQKFNLKWFYVKSNFRTFIDINVLSKMVSSKIDGEWWHEFQHGIGILGLFAPLAFNHHYGNLYIASSMYKGMNIKYTCASDPTIDNNLKFACCNVFHDAFETNRQEKVKNICNYVKNNNIDDLKLRVCWQSSGGDNCSECEKCYRTILEILVLGYDPNKLGFAFSSEKRKVMMERLPKMDAVKENSYDFYRLAQNELLNNYSFDETPEDLKWLRDYKFKGKPNKFRKFLKKVKRKLKSILEKI